MNALILAGITILVATIFAGGILTACKAGADDGLCKYDYIGGDEQ